VTEYFTEKDSEIKVNKVKCPDDIKPAVGDEFTCTVDIDDGPKVEMEVKRTKDGWEFSPAEEFLLGVTLEEKVGNYVEKTFSKPDKIDCGARVHEVGKGDKVDCKAKLKDGKKVIEVEFTGNREFTMVPKE
jgi:hypothetical protein